jgi:glycosyltransferase involved in cell wall biosynthesis
VPKASRLTVSVLTTNHNYARWLRDTLDSVSRQDYPDIEHVVIDNGSTDGSVEILAGYSSDKLIWRSGPDVGQARALNVAFRMSSGDIIGWLSSDDAYYDTGAVSTVVETFERHPDAALVYGHAVLIGPDGLQLHAQWVPPPRILRWRPPMHIIQPAVFIRRSALGNELVDESFEIAMDTELWLRLRRTHQFVRLGRVLAAERHHEGRKSYAMKELSAKEVGRIGRQAADRGRPQVRRRKAWRIAYRLAGLSLLPQIQRRPTSFDGRLDGRWSLVRRQVLTPRSRM